MIRRALSQLHDFNKLANHPLTTLAVLEQRILARNAQDNTLERAQELRTLLLEAIAQLKPATAVAFDTNRRVAPLQCALLSYVVGVKPYNRRAALIVWMPRRNKRWNGYAAKYQNAPSTTGKIRKMYESPNEHPGQCSLHQQRTSAVTVSRPTSSHPVVWLQRVIALVAASATAALLGF